MSLPKWKIQFKNRGLGGFSRILFSSRCFSVLFFTSFLLIAFFCPSLLCSFPSSTPLLFYFLFCPFSFPVIPHFPCLPFLLPYLPFPTLSHPSPSPSHPFPPLFPLCISSGVGYRHAAGITAARRCLSLLVSPPVRHCDSAGGFMSCLRFSFFNCPSHSITGALISTRVDRN